MVDCEGILIDADQACQLGEEVMKGTIVAASLLRPASQPRLHALML